MDKAGVGTIADKEEKEEGKEARYSPCNLAGTGQDQEGEEGENQRHQGVQNQLEAHSDLTVEALTKSETE